MNLDYQKLKGVVPAVVQDHRTGCVLMLAYMNEEAFRRTVETGYATFFSRSRNRLWIKGEDSGHRLRICEVAIDCDHDTVLLKVEVIGPGVCHAGYQSCFFRRLEDRQWIESEAPTFDPVAVYGGAR